jgi:hypothetical protein
MKTEKITHDDSSENSLIVYFLDHNGAGSTDDLSELRRDSPAMIVTFPDVECRITAT